MIIRSNLASSPLRNHSLFLLGCVLSGLAVICFSAWNAMSLMDSRTKTGELKASIEHQQTQLSKLQNKAADLRGKIVRIKTPQFVSETEFINNAIKRRTFSWTSLFDHFEEVLPGTVKMISITPKVGEKNIEIKLEMAAGNLKDMLDLVRVLEGDAAFSHVILLGEQSGVDELLRFSISLRYLPPVKTGVVQ